MSEKHNEQNISDELEEEMRFISKNYAERLNKKDTPLSGEELYTEAMKTLDEIIKKDCKYDIF